MSKFTFSVVSLLIFLFDIRGVVSARSGEDLVDLINDWRRSKGLSSIPKSSALFKVANAHTTNQCVSSYKGRKQKCWNPHSWEDVGKRESFDTCCYDPKRGSTWDCMWDKPSEIAGFNTDGFEVSAGGDSPRSALSAWKRSSGHTDVILNQGKWKYRTWRAIGCAGAPDRMRHWNCWFATDSDRSSYRYQGEPRDCSGGHWGNIWEDVDNGKYDYAYRLDDNDAPAYHEEKGNINGSDTMIVCMIAILGGLAVVIVTAVIIYCFCLKKGRNAKGVKVEDEDAEAEEVDEEEECVIEYEEEIDGGMVTTVTAE